MRDLQKDDGGERKVISFGYGLFIWNLKIWGFEEEQTGSSN